MHELGLVVYVMDAIESLAQDEHFTKVGTVTLELGEVSSVMAAYFTDCWDYSCGKSDLLKEAELKLEMIPAVSVCEDCGEEYRTLEYKKQCPHCGSYFTHLLKGDEFNIKEVEVC